MNTTKIAPKACTEKQAAMMRKIRQSPFIAENGGWSDASAETWSTDVCSDRSDAAVIGSLIKKGFIRGNFQGTSEATIRFTDAGREWTAADVAADEVVGDAMAKACGFTAAPAEAKKIEAVVASVAQDETAAERAEQAAHRAERERERLAHREEGVRESHERLAYPAGETHECRTCGGLGDSADGEPDDGGCEDCGGSGRRPGSAITAKPDALTLGLAELKAELRATVKARAAAEADVVAAERVLALRRLAATNAAADVQVLIGQVFALARRIAERESALRRAAFGPASSGSCDPGRCSPASQAPALRGTNTGATAAAEKAPQEIKLCSRKSSPASRP